MKNNLPISTIVTRRIRRINALRAVISVPVFSSLVLLLSLWGISREVWVAKVIANMPAISDLPAVASFFGNAFLHTDLIVQAATVIALAALIWLAHECASTLTNTLGLRRT